jgi:ABC-type amino acid transport substrate-binding protein
MKLTGHLLLLCLFLLGSERAISEELIFVKQNSEPKYLQNNNGLCDQIYQGLAEILAAKGIEVTVDTTFYPVKRYFQMLETGEAQGFCGAGETSERLEKFNFVTQPVYEVSYILLAHESENFVPTSFDDLIDHQIVVGAFYGTSSSRWLMSHEGLIVNDNFQTLDQAIKLVSQGKLRYFYYHDLALNHFVKSKGLPIKTLPTKLITIPQWLVLSKTISPETTKLVNEALTAMSDSGQLKKIQDSFLSK